MFSVFDSWKLMLIREEQCVGFQRGISIWLLELKFDWEFYMWLIVLKFTTFAAAVAAKSLQSCPTLRPHRRQPTRLPRSWDSPGKNTSVGCHFLLRCMKVKSESEFAQSCLSLRDPMDCSLPGSSVHGIFQARVLEWGAIAFSFITSSLGLKRN